jgi:ribosomal protein S18 acetylase RimI-like enzyme
MAVEFVPMRWWQALDFVRTDFQTMKGRDPWADQVLARPWTPSNLVSLLYEVAGLPSSLPYFVVVSGERVGTLWLIVRDDFLYIYSLGLLPEFRDTNFGMQVGRLLINSVNHIEDVCRRHDTEITICRVAVRNEPMQRMVQIFGAKPLGVATTTLKLSSPPDEPPDGLDVKKLGRSAGEERWKQWNMHAARHAAGSDGERSITLMMNKLSWIHPLPKGKSMGLYQGDEEIGLAVAHQREDKLDIVLLTSTAFWSGPQTAGIVAAVASRLDSPIGYLTLTLSHADAIDKSAALNFERDRDKERQFLYWIMQQYYETKASRKRRKG